MAAAPLGQAGGRGFLCCSAPANPGPFFASEFILNALAKSSSAPPPAWLKRSFDPRNRQFAHLNCSSAESGSSLVAGSYFEQAAANLPNPSKSRASATSPSNRARSPEDRRDACPTLANGGQFRR